MNQSKKSSQLFQSVPPIVWIGLSLTIVVGLMFVGRWRADMTQSASGSPRGLATSYPVPDAKHLLSTGDRLFFPEAGTLDKHEASAAFRRRDYRVAAQLFETSLQRKPNDPEALIYMNNAKAIDRNPLQLAVSVPISSDANGAKEILRGVAQAQEEFNASGGVKGRLIQIVIADDGDNPEVARGIATHFVNHPEILGVVGHYASSVTLATAEIYDRGQLVTISPISSGMQLSHKSPYLFRSLPSDAIAAQSLAKYTTQHLNRKKPVVYFNSNSDYSKSLMSEFRSAIVQNNGQVVAEYDLANSNLDPTYSLQIAKVQGADVIMLASSTDTLDNALQVAHANQSQLPLLGGDDVYAPQILERGQAAVQNLVVAVPWHILAQNSQAFAGRSRQLWGGDVNWRTATAYDATNALIAGLKQSPTRFGIKTALAQPTFIAPGASQAITFLPSGDRNMPAQLVQVAPGKRSGFGYDFLPITP